MTQPPAPRDRARPWLALAGIVLAVALVLLLVVLHVTGILGPGAH